VGIRGDAPPAFAKLRHGAQARGYKIDKKFRSPASALILYRRPKVFG
jgi:hypothetical protein